MTKKPIFKKWWFWVIIIVVIAVIASSGKNSENDGGGTEDGTGNAPVTEKTIGYETVDLQTMLDDLSDNAMKAEQTYQNKHVEITGKIKNIDSDGSYISIEPVGADELNFTTVTCNLKNDTQRKVIMEKSKGDTVVIKGKVTSIGEVLGHRNIQITDELYAVVTAEILRSVDLGCRIFYFGGYGDFDDLCYKIVTKIKEDKPEVKIRRAYRIYIV